MEKHNLSETLKQQFYLYPNVKTRYFVKVFDSFIKFIEVSNANTGIDIPYADITGCDCRRGSKKSDNAAYVSIFCYMHKKKLLGDNSRRYRKVYTLQLCNHHTYDENVKDAHLWKSVLRNLTNGKSS